MKEGRIYRVKVAVIRREANGEVKSNKKEWNVVALDSTRYDKDAWYIIGKAGITIPEGTDVTITKYRHRDMVSVNCRYNELEVIASIDAYDLRKITYGAREGLKKYSHKVSSRDIDGIVNNCSVIKGLKVKKVNNKK